MLILVLAALAFMFASFGFRYALASDDMGGFALGFAICLPFALMGVLGVVAFLAAL